MKTLKLTLTALLTAGVLFSWQFFIAGDRLYWSYRCWTHAKNILSCHGDAFFDFTADLYGLTYEGNTGNYIDNQILYYGAYEKPVLFLLRDLMTNGYLGNGVFLDIGANTGQHSLFMSRYASQIHAFEPYPPVLERFRNLVEKNRIQNIVIHPIGLGNENSKLPFYKPPDNNLGTGSFVDGFKKDNSYMGLLEIRVGDAELESAGVKDVAVIKMDIEGYEKPALEGLRNTLVNNRPFVVFELTTDPASKTSIKTKRELKSLFPENYDFLSIDESEGLESGKYRLVNFENTVHFGKAEQHDILAFPNEKKQRLILD
jgi:FkbM family methyltransferase